MRRPSFLPSLDELEDQALERSAVGPEKGSQFDHPTAKALFKVALAITLIAHVLAGVWLVFNGHG
ncbi:hypothetical protein [Actinomadura kijaniata]|uniref:hypothetical protein n=1 Tax=Actinomadura kijaniata TaxID=46161 RepID=UPI000835E937|nr:hypothetical protein [Actinomadura kijaniata]